MDIPKPYEEIAKQIGRLDELQEYIDGVVANGNVSTNNGYLCYWEQNIEIADNIPKDKIVIDVGCSFGIQHILYRNHKLYIGIQKFKEGHNAYNNFQPAFRVFTDNAIILSASFKEVAPMLWPIIKGQEDKFYGIAHQSLFNDQEVNAEDIEWFKRLFPRNYFVTNLAGRPMKYD